jgi:carboxypeptidase Taq
MTDPGTAAASGTGAKTTSPAATYDNLIKLVRDAHVLGATAALLSWDQEVMMPKRGVKYRSEQLAMLARLHHEREIDPRLGDVLGECEGDKSLTADTTNVSAVNLREIRRRYDRKTKLPVELVEEEARLASLAQHEWAEARKESDFKRFQPWLEKIVKLLRRKAECYGWAADGEPWDALAEDYEPGCTAKKVEAVFTPLRDRLARFLGELMDSKHPPRNIFAELELPIEKQEKFVRFVAESIGFDFSRGRLDQSTHPFCSGTHCNDVRLTTRFRNTDVHDALGSTMHECGHGIYEQGLLEEHIGTPMGESVSLGIHESQSRMWENQVGRSAAFWSWCYPKLKDFFGDKVAKYSLEEVYGAINFVKPGFIRVEADEATYNMHIMVRFELERAILAGDLEVASIPEAWNTRYRKYLDLDVPDDRRGCLQDVHWATTAMGYFPTYTLGNLYCAQFFEKALADMPDLYEQFARGEFTALRKWLNKNIHQHGQRYRADELCKVVTGKPLSADPLMRHLEGKLRPVYKI